MSPLLNLPLEVLEHLIYSIESESALNSISQTCKRLQHIAGEFLYQENHLSHDDSALRWAAEKGRENTIKRAIYYGVNVEYAVVQGAILSGQIDAAVYVLTNFPETRSVVNRHRDDGNTLLYEVARLGHFDVCRELIKHGADINLKCDLEKAKCRGLPSAEANSVITISPFSIAASNGHYQVIEAFIELGYDIHQDHKDGWPVLCLAAGNNRLRVAEILVQNKIDIFQKNIWSESSLYLAAREGNVDIIRLLLKQPEIKKLLSDCSSQGMAPLHIATANNRRDSVLALLEGGAGVDLETHFELTALHIAAHYGYEDIAKILLEHGAAAKHHWIVEWSPLHCAANQGHYKMVKLLVDYFGIGALDEVNNVENTALHLAIRQGNLKTIEYLLQQGNTLHIRGCNTLTPLMTAVLEENEHLVVPMIDSGHFDINWAGCHHTNQWTALHCAASTGNLNIIKILLDNGADVTKLSWLGTTALHEVVKHPEALGLLLKAVGADPLIQDKNGRNVLFHAVKSGNLDSVKQLLLCGKQSPSSDINQEPLVHDISRIQPDIYGFTPLICAIRHQYLDIIDLLLKPDFSQLLTADARGKDAIWWAKDGGNQEIIDLIRTNIEVDGAVEPNPDQKSLAKKGCICEICTLPEDEDDELWHFHCTDCEPYYQSWRGDEYLICLRCYVEGYGCRSSESHTITMLRCLKHTILDQKRKIK